MPSLERSLNQAMDLQRAGRLDRAESIYQTILRKHPGQPDALHLLGVIAFQRGDAERALRLVDMALRAMPRAADYHSNRGQFCLSLGRLDEAISSFEKAIEIRPDHPQAWLNRGVALQAQGRHHDAIVWLARRRAADPHDLLILNSLAVSYRAVGRWAEAVGCYQQALTVAPGDANTLLNWGNLLAQTGQPREAIRFFEQAAVSDPNFAEAFNNLGNALHAVGQVEDAIPHLQRALALRPVYPEAWNNLGVVAQARGEWEEAERCFVKACEQRTGFVEATLNLGLVLARKRDFERARALYRDVLRAAPSSADAYHNMGASFHDEGRTSEALDCYRQALALDPSHFNAHASFGNALAQLGRFDEALVEHEAALQLNPGALPVLNNTAVLLHKLRRFDEAREIFERVLAADPNHGEALVNYGALLRDMGQVASAREYLDRAVTIAPTMPFAWNNRGTCLSDLGDFEGAVSSFGRAVELNPAYHHARSNMLLNLHYRFPADPGALWKAHLDFGAQFAPAEWHDDGRLRDAGRRLRIGYVSADYRRHSVAYFLESLLDHHGGPGSGFDVYCYSTGLFEDAVTKRFRERSGDRWRDVRGYAVERVADLVRQDAIDILVDLGGHTAGNLLPVFALKPAPVQITWLGYPNTTGLAAMDYRITDAAADPPGLTEQWHSEQLVRLSTGFLCYRPEEEAPAVSPLPALGRGAFVFGSFNNLSKVNSRVLETWAEILKRRPDSILLLKNKSLDVPEIRQRIQQFFVGQGLDPGRLYLAPPIAGVDGHLALYHQIDLALDPFPYHGTTTTCEALWMGVPVISLEGETHVSRVAVSLYERTGVSGYLARTAGEYVDLAIERSRDLEGLARLRGELRERMLASPLTNGALFAREFESALRQAWTVWCNS